MMPVLPVANGVLPRPHGGVIEGMFLADAGGEILERIGVGGQLLICPWIVDADELYPVGVVAMLAEFRREVVAAGEEGEEAQVCVVRLEGREHARWHSLETVESILASGDVEPLRLYKNRHEYPAVSGAGWMPEGGYTEIHDLGDIPVTLYGHDLATGKSLEISANLGGLVTQETAHTVEHGMIRALRTFGLCTARTLMRAMSEETKELKASVENSIRFQMPEVLGVTAAGACGNPMTNMAQFYLTKELFGSIKSGRDITSALDQARRTAMSRIMSELDLTTQPGLRTLQALKRGMAHDDTPLAAQTAKRVLERFPFDPWT